ncbi:MAG: hypothetical protein NC086_04085, partial [Alistipes sp.]|nr:hypothetical protein [Alistipes sp.]
ISASGIMVLCKACDKYLELLSGEENNSLISDERIMSGLMSGKMKKPVQQLLEYLKNYDTITTTIGKEITGKSEAQVRRYLKALTDCGVIKSKKTTKGNIYTRVKK